MVEMNLGHTSSQIKALINIMFSTQPFGIYNISKYLG